MAVAQTSKVQPKVTVLAGVEPEAATVMLPLRRQGILPNSEAGAEAAAPTQYQLMLAQVARPYLAQGVEAEEKRIALTVGLAGLGVPMRLAVAGQVPHQGMVVTVSREVMVAATVAAAVKSQQAMPVATAGRQVGAEAVLVTMVLAARAHAVKSESFHGR